MHHCVRIRRVRVRWRKTTVPLTTLASNSSTPVQLLLGHAPEPVEGIFLHCKDGFVVGDYFVDKIMKQKSAWKPWIEREVAKYGNTTECAGEFPVEVGEARPPGFAKYSATSVPESELAESFHEASSSGEDEVGPSWSRASGTTSTAVAKLVGEARPLAVLVAAAHETIPPDCVAFWDQYEARFQKVYNEFDEETRFGTFRLVASGSTIQGRALGGVR